MNAMIWLAAMIILIVIEIVTVGLTTIWFAIGALVAILYLRWVEGGFCKLRCFWQFHLECWFSQDLLPFKYINSSRTKTNYEGIIGKVVRITRDVNNLGESGSAVVNGQEWTVRAAIMIRQFQQEALRKSWILKA